MEAVKNAVWNLVTLVLVGVVVYLLYARGKLDAYLPSKYASMVILHGQTAEVAPTPAPAPVAPAVAPAPEPQKAAPVLQVQAEAPASAPAPEAAPPAPEAAPSLAGLPPQQIPRQVKLLKPMVFPVIVNGRNAGTISAPAGMLVQVIRVQGEQLVVQNGGATKTVDAGDTDIFQRTQVLGNGQTP